MEQSITISNHAIAKHLDVTNVHASVFFDMSTMIKSIKKCLEHPDFVEKQGERFKLIKWFPYEIGRLRYTDRPSKTIKVVLTRTRNNAVCVITAYPIAYWSKQYIIMKINRKMTLQIFYILWIAEVYICISCHQFQLDIRKVTERLTRTRWTISWHCMV